MPRERLTEKELEEANISYTLINTEKYYDVGEIRDKFPDMKFNTDNIRVFDIGRGVRIVDIEPMTKFDMSIRRFKRGKQ